MHTSIRVLIIEDSEDDTFLLAAELKEGGYNPIWKRVDTKETLLSALREHSWDLIISDYVMPHLNGLRALRLVQDMDLDIPFIFVSGKVGEDTAIEAMKAGAHDYILKDNLTRLVPAVQRELRDTAVRMEQKRAEEALRESEKNYRNLVERSSDGIIVLQDGLFRYVNRRFVQISGYSKEELMDRPFVDFLTPDEAIIYHDMYSRRMSGEDVPEVYEATLTKRNGSKIDLEISAGVITYQGRQADLVMVRDVTERKKAERLVAEALERERRYSLLLQRALLPTEPSIGPGYRVALHYVPAFAHQEIGGDFYDVFRTGNGKAGILIGDISGKGLEAASMAATTRSTIHALAHEEASPGTILTRTNAVLCTHLVEPGPFVTAFLAILDIDSGHIDYANGGHLPTKIRRASGEIDSLWIGEVPICVLDKVQFKQEEAVLNPGDKMVLYTDGISEARRDAEQFGEEGIERVMKEHGYRSAEDLAGELLAAASRWADGRLKDDAAIVVVERLDQEKGH